MQNAVQGDERLPVTEKVVLAAAGDFGHAYVALNFDGGEWRGALYLCLHTTIETGKEHRWQGRIFDIHSPAPRLTDPIHSNRWGALHAAHCKALILARAVLANERETKVRRKAAKKVLALLKGFKP
jgi:hypothetical protein